MKKLSAADNTGMAMYSVIGFAVLALIAPVVAQTFGGNYWVRVLDFALLYILLALGLNIVVGFAGLLDLGYIAFFAVGAYMMALLSSPHLTSQFAWLAHLFPGGIHLGFWWVLLLAAPVAAAAGALLGAPTLKLRGDYLAIVTLGFGEIVRIFMNNLDRPINITNGPKGITAVDPVRIFGLDLSKAVDLFGYKLTPVMMYYYLLIVMVMVIIFVNLRLQHSRIGRAWVAIRWAQPLAGSRAQSSVPSRALCRRSRSCCGNRSTSWRSSCSAVWATFPASSTAACCWWASRSCCANWRPRCRR